MKLLEILLRLVKPRPSDPQQRVVTAVQMPPEVTKIRKDQARLASDHIELRNWLRYYMLEDSEADERNGTD